MSKNKNPKIVYPQLLNPATGEFKINNEFVISNKTTIEDLKAHFGEKMSADNLGNYSVRNVQIGELYFIFAFAFSNNTIKNISFVLRDNPYDEIASWDNFDEQEQKEEGKFMKKWLADQIRIDINTYAWGKAGTSYDFHNLSTSCTINYRDVITGEKLKQIL